MGNLDVWWWRSFHPVAQPSDLSSVLELIALKEEGPEGLSVFTHFRELLSTSEV